MKKLRVGMVGAGSMSKKHIEAYGKQSSVEIAALCDINLDLAKLRAEEWGITQVYDNYQKMLDSCELDIVNVVTSNNTHAPITIAALNAGKHVLCEKPPAMDTLEAIKMEEAAVRNQKLLMYGLPFRYSEKVGVIKDFHDKGLFGEIYYAKTGFIRRCGNPGGWFSNKTIARGGPLLDLGVHMIDLAMYIMGKPEPVSVYGVTSAKMGNRSNIKGFTWYRSANYTTGINDVEDLAVAIIKFSNGATLFVETSYASNIKSEALYMEMMGTKAGVKVEPDIEIYSEQNDYMFDMKPILDDYSLNWSKSVDNEINHFIKCILEGEKCISPAKDGVTIMRIIDAIYSSAQSGEVVKI